eukprot:TRINITY_DN422_c0_g1_i4.p1 TRINITY_DN422_c0_g1~~TRINITY_DN422_c0_g1_i4.p1  ORF type:complete len:720 (+),score=261.57 TRINITY_DN422_c0_g1_i4:3-2162(+)
MEEQSGVGRSPRKEGSEVVSFVFQVDDDDVVSPRKDGGNVGSNSITNAISPRKDGDVGSPRKDGGNVGSPRKDGGNVISPRNNNNHPSVVSPRKDGNVISPRKDEGNVVSPRKDNSVLSPRKDGGNVISPRRDGGTLTSNSGHTTGTTGATGSLSNSKDNSKDGSNLGTSKESLDLNRIKRSENQVVRMGSVDRTLMTKGNVLSVDEGMVPYHSYSMEETRSFGAYINKVLQNDEDLKDVLPINTDTTQLFDVVSQGVILSKLINKVVPNTIEERKIVKKPNRIFDIIENHNLTIEGAKKIGCKFISMRAQDFVEKHAHLVLSILWQILRIALLSDISVEQHPQMAEYLLDEPKKLKSDIEGEEVVEIKTNYSGPEQTLLNWFNALLSKTDYNKRINNFSGDLKDLKAFLYLISQIEPEYVSQQDLLEEELNKRASILVAAASRLGCNEFITEGDIMKGNANLNLAFIATLFHKHSDLERIRAQQKEDEVSANEKKRVEEEERKKKQEEEDRVREEERKKEEEERKRKEEEEEAERKKKAEEEEAERKKKEEEEEAERKKKEEEEAERKRKEDEEEAERKKKEEEEAEKKRIEEEAERKRIEEEQRIIDEEEARRFEESENKRAEENEIRWAREEVEEKERLRIWLEQTMEEEERLNKIRREEAERYYEMRIKEMTDNEAAAAAADVFDPSKLTEGRDRIKMLQKSKAERAHSCHYLVG